MRLALLLRVPVVGDVDLAAEHGLDAFVPGCLVEIDRAGERAVVGQRDGRHLELGSALREVRDPARAVEDRVLGVDVEVDERRFGHGRSSLAPCPEGALTPWCDTPDVRRSRLVPLALVVTLLLAVVAIAARGRPLGTRAGNGGALPPSFWDYTYTTIVIVVVPLFVTGLIAGFYVRRQSGMRRNYWHSLLRMLVIYFALVALELLLFRHFPLPHLHPQRHGPQEPGSGLGGAQNQGHHHSIGSRALHFRWDELLVFLGLLLLAAMIAVRLSRRDPRTPSEVAPEILAAALDESIDDLRTDADLRRAIIAAYARMETALAAAGVRRHPAEAPLEYLELALLCLDTSAEAVRRLTDLFEWARFSHHEPEPSMRDEAVDALIAVRDELRASELTPA